MGRVVRQVTLQTWNCFGTAMDLKAVLRRRGPPDAHRLTHPAVWSELHRADVLCMQELWIPDAFELFDALEIEHKIRDSNENRLVPLSIGGSGLGIASRSPLVQSEQRWFRERGWGTDRGARKGWLHARIELDTSRHRALDVFTTHLQSGLSARCRAARSRQLQELGRAIDELAGAGRPLLVCGDMNIDGLEATRDGEYDMLMEVLAGCEDLGARADLPTMCPDRSLNTLAHRYWAKEPVQRLDYLLFRPPADPWLSVDRVERFLDQQLPPHGGPATYASDHFGLRVVFELEEA